ncbi:hypothetical protein RJ641_004779 [Dillenia turbinata]|uniref:Uncharacterized protein n=1 Tax=Dillenia turbinata TaxID=194707 RepID=A0AAN8VAN3_9MAGN
MGMHLPTKLRISQACTGLHNASYHKMVRLQEVFPKHAPKDRNRSVGKIGLSRGMNKATLAIAVNEAALERTEVVKTEFDDMGMDGFGSKGCMEFGTVLELVYEVRVVHSLPEV